MIRMTGAWVVVVAAAVIACGGSTDRDGSGSGGTGGGSGGGAVGGTGGGTMCALDGTPFLPGQSYELDCNTCTCMPSGEFACTNIACVECVYQGKLYPEGATFPAGDGCNECRCEPSGYVSCTLAECAPSCTYGGQSYAPGEVFPSLDGCNKCTCASDGNVSCTEIACACDPAKEWWRDYVGDSPAECATILYSCPEHTQAFSNQCGCGCEQDASCPPVIDCKPSGACDPELLAKCPYSGVSK